LNDINLLQDFVIPKSTNLKPLCLQPCGSGYVMRSLFLLVVLSAVDFNYQPFLQTDEIYDVPSSRLLPSKLVSCELTSTEMSPQDTLSVCGIIPQTSGSGSHSPLPFLPPRRGEGINNVVILP